MTTITPTTIKCVLESVKKGDDPLTMDGVILDHVLSKTKQFL